MEREHIHFVTGWLAEAALRREVSALANTLKFEYSVQVLPISVAALMTTNWVAKRLDVPTSSTKVVLPGYCGGDLQAIRDSVSVPVERGPKDLRDLPTWFSQSADPFDWSNQQIEIIAEINNVPALDPESVYKQAIELRQAGADRIDLGCNPEGGWTGVGDCVRRLVDSGFKVSIDSFDPSEVSTAVRAGADLVLSVNSSNRESALDWGTEVVVIPDDPAKWERMDDTIDFLDAKRIAFRIDPILAPVGLGFGASLDRYFHARRRWPKCAMMMGIGNVTELSDCDSVGINFVLLAICQELGVQSVLTTQVINWARTSVPECDWGRRLVWQAVARGIPPKNMLDKLILLRDPRLKPLGREALYELASQIRDGNFRLFAEPDGLWALAREQIWNHDDPYLLFDAIRSALPDSIDPSHAFYLGYELCKAELARGLGKQYVQDEPLRWGFLEFGNKTHQRASRRGARRQNVANQKPKTD